ncbi:hypothetical protein FRC02_008624 [Tulasnella sp. 418]|nr:hypothetical protein FRC02_008624 [Tulasnella sp. 418]
MTTSAMKSMYAILAVFAIFLNLFQLVSAHGYVKAITIDETDYKGPLPNEGGEDSIIRGISTSFPVKDEEGNDIICGPNAQKAALSGAAKPGSKLTYDWAGGDNGKWPHNTGPMLTYITPCNGDCSDFDPSDAKWTKIEEVGRKENSNLWVQNDLFEGGTYTFNLPNELPNGNYLIRHEIIGLHIAGEKGGAEFYPSCAQITVSGGQDGSLPSDETVRFPGAYTPTDPGILVNAFDASKPYQFPGGDVVRLSGSHSNGGNNDNNNNNGDNNGGDNGDNNDGSDQGEQDCKDEDDSQNNDQGDGNTDNDPFSVPASSRERPTSTERVVSTVTVVTTVFVDGNGREAPTATPTAQKAEDPYRLRIRRSRIVGRSHI